MQPLTLDFRSWFSRGYDLLSEERSGTEHKQRSQELIWGVLAVLFTAVLIAAGVLVFMKTPGHYRVTAEFSEAGQINTGDSVRVAGVPVGTVKKIILKSDHVNVEMAVKNGTFIGDQTTADVKMLTLVAVPSST